MIMYIKEMEGSSLALFKSYETKGNKATTASFLGLFVSDNSELI